MKKLTTFASITFAALLLAGVSSCRKGPDPIAEGSTNDTTTVFGSVEKGGNADNGGVARVDNATSSASPIGQAPVAPEAATVTATSTTSTAPTPTSDTAPTTTAAPEKPSPTNPAATSTH